MGIGLAHLPRWAVRERLAAGELVALLPDAQFVVGPVYLLRAPGALPAAVRALGQHLVRSLRQVLV